MSRLADSSDPVPERQIGDSIWRLFEAVSGVPRGQVEALLSAQLPSLEDQMGARAAARVLHEVRAMLASDGELLVERELAVSAGDEPDTQEEGVEVALFGAPRIPGYRLTELIGEGGMSDVYLAERVGVSFDQRLAIKVLRRGLLHQDMVERFEQERDLLAQLEHPAIVTLIDAGTTADGRPYLVLPYVEGEPITVFCSFESCTRTLERVVELCQAVQFAHNKLVVHRDLKPSNVLVTADGRLRLLDFGVAKLLGEPDDRRRLASTDAHEVPAPMTRGRAAPEQRTGGEVSTATDVWALGVLLHELLTGRLPDLDRRGAVARLYCEGVDRDLVEIVLRCLRTDAAQRYRSVAHLADDLGRYAGRRPIMARRRTLAYRSRLFVRRNPISVGLAGVLATAVILLTASTLRQARSLVEERDRARALRGNAEASLHVLAQLLEEGDPVTGEPRPVIEVEQLLRRADGTVEELRDQPLAQAQLRGILGQLRAARGQLLAARNLLASSLTGYRQELGAESPEALQMELQLIGLEHRITGDHGDGLRRAQRILELAEPLQREHPLLAAQAYRLVGGFRVDGEGERLVLRAAEIYRTRGETRRLADTVSSLIVVRILRGDRDGAREAALEGLSLYRQLDGASAYMVLVMRSHLASLIEKAEERLEAQREILAQRIDLLGPEHQHVGNSHLQLGTTLRELGRLDEAIDSFRRAELATEGTSLKGRAVKEREFAENLRSRRASVVH